MGIVFTGASMSLDGYIAGPGESGFEHLFQWYGNGDVVVPMPAAPPELVPRMTEAGAGYFRKTVEMTGALVCGRGVFDFTNGWGGQHPMGKPVVVLSHSVPDGLPREGENFTFVESGIEEAVEVAKRLAGEKAVGVNGGTIASQCLEAGLLDEVWIDLVPVLLGDGKPFFSRLSKAPVTLDGPLSMVEGKSVTHLRYRVRH